MKKLLILGGILVLLKVTNVLNISWWLITLPLWIVPVSVLTVVLAVLILISLSVIF